MAAALCFAMILASFAVLFAVPSRAVTVGEFEFETDEYTNAARLTKYNGSSASVTVPEKAGGYPVVGIEIDCFRQRYELKRITLPDSLRWIAERAFYECISLKTVSGAPNLFSIGERAFYGCRALEAAPIRDKLESIGASAFYGCESLTSVTIPDTAYSVNEDVFSNCTSLKTAKRNILMIGIVYSKFAQRSVWPPHGT